MVKKRKTVITNTVFSHSIIAIANRKPEANQVVFHLFSRLADLSRFFCAILFQQIVPCFRFIYKSCLKIICFLVKT